MSSPVQALVLLASLVVGQPEMAPNVSSQKAALQRSVDEASMCIFNAVKQDRRRSEADLTVLITEAFTSTCLIQVRAMVEVHDQYFGEGEGDVFLTGQYFEWLPRFVERMLRTAH